MHEWSALRPLEHSLPRAAADKRNVLGFQPTLFTERVFVPRLQPLVFVLRGVVGRHEFGESTAITHRLNDWALLMHMSSPFWVRATFQSWLLCMPAGRICSVWLRNHVHSATDCSWRTSGGGRQHRGRAASDRRCCRYLLVGRLW